MKAVVRQEKCRVEGRSGWPEFEFDLEPDERIIEAEIEFEKHELSTDIRSYTCMATIVKGLEEKR